MASRVNTRFVAFLAIGLMLLGGGAMVSVYFALRKGGADYAKLGDKYMAEGKYEKATEYFGKAVYKKQTNAEWIAKWLTAMEKTTPSPRSLYLDRYVKDYLPALKKYSDASPEDVGAQKRFLDEQYRRLRMSAANNVGAWDAFVQVVDDTIKKGFKDANGPARELKRYIGLANVFKLYLVPEDKQKELVASIEEDLAAAVAANPADEEAVAELANIRTRRAGEARAAKDTEAAARFDKLATDGLDAYRAKYGPSSRVMWRQMQIEFIQAAQTAEATGIPLTRAQLYLDKHPRFVEIMDVIKNEPKEKLDLVVLSQLCQEASRSTKIGNVGVLELLYVIEAKHPELYFLDIFIGRFELQSQHFDKAVAAFQKVIDTPDMPLSMDGYMLFEMRADAYRQQILAKLSERETVLQKLKDVKEAAGVRPEDAPRLLSEAKALRQKLAEYVGESERVLLYVDAKISYAEGNFETARIALDKYNERSDNKDAGALVLLGQIMQKVGNSGAARTAYLTALTNEPDNVQALLNLADLEKGEENFAAAVRAMEAVEKLYPNLPQLKEQISKVKELQVGKEKGGGAIADPVVRAATEAKELVSGLNPDYAAAAEVLSKALEKSHDPTLYPMLARVLQADGKTEEALKVVNDGLERAPGNPKLEGMAKALKVKDPLEALLLAIDQDEQGSPLQKCIWRHLVYGQYGKKDEASKALDEAAKLDPNSPLVLELKFLDAMRAHRAAVVAKDKNEQDKRMAEAKVLAEQATAVDADHVGGLTFKAKIEVGQERYADAIASLEAALEKDRNNLQVWRQLGFLRLTVGKPDTAVAAFEKALAIRPRDIDSIKGYLQAKLNAGQRDEALAFARQNQETGIREGDMDFIDAWLDLEAVAAGGDRKYALEQRQFLAKRFPDNVQNNVALIRLLIDAKSFSDARTMIDKLRASGDQPEYVELDIRWHMAQGNMPKVADTFNNWVLTLPKEKHNEQPYVGLANIFVTYGRYDAAIQALKDGKKHQDPKTLGADRRLGEIQFVTQRYAQAIETFDSVLAADPTDPEFKVRGQIVEAYLRLRKFPDAKKRLDAMGAGIETNSRMLLLKGETLAGLGQLEEAGRTYDAAIATAKDDPIGYMKRAEFLANDPKRIGDAQQDLKQALVLAPRSLPARRMLAQLHIHENQMDKAVEVMRQGLIEDPDNDALRFDLIGLHLRLKQDREAIALVEDALKRRKEDPIWLFRGREVMYALNRFNDAAGYALRLWERNKDVDAALAYLDAAIKVEPTDFVKAMEVLQTPSLNTPKDVRLLVARARLQLKRGRATEANADLAAALKLIDQANRGQAQAFYSGVSLIFPDNQECLKALTSLRPKEGYRGWMAFLYSNLKSSFPATMSEGLSELQAIAESNAELLLRKQTYSLIGSRWRTEKKYDEAIRWWKEGLKLDPADAELNNNVAYCLAEDLNKPEEAIAYAEKAAVAMPNEASILDTLGTIYIRLKQLEKAEDAMSRAMSTVTSADVAVAVLLHMAELRLLQGKNTEAASLVRRAQELIKTEDRLQGQYTKLLDELKAKTETK